MSVILLNDNWSFHKENENAETISIPHTYNAVDGQNGTSMWRGKGFYTNEFTLTESDLEQDIYLEVGAYAISVSAPKDRMDDARVEQFTYLILDAKQRIQNELGN